MINLILTLVTSKHALLVMNWGKRLKHLKYFMIITVYSLIEESQVNGTFINYLVPVFVPERQKDTDTAIIIPTHVDDRMNDHVQTCTSMGTRTSIHLIGNSKRNWKEGLSIFTPFRKFKFVKEPITVWEFQEWRISSCSSNITSVFHLLNSWYLQITSPSKDLDFFVTSDFEIPKPLFWNFII